MHTLQDIYYAENQITKALPTMIGKTRNPALKQAFQKHLGETEQHVKRLEEAFKILGKDAKGVTCPAIDGIIKEANEIISDCDDDEVRDAAMLASAQAVEHYEMTRYGTLISWSKQSGKQNIATLLTQTLNEEKAADKKLTMLAEGGINQQAADAGGAEEEDEEEAPVKAKKSATAPSSSELTKLGLLSPKEREKEKTGMSQSTPTTPKKSHIMGREGDITPTPRRLDSRSIRDIASPTLQSSYSTQKERMRRRRMMEDEVDEDEGMDEMPY